MNLKNKIKAAQDFANYLLSDDEELQNIISKSYAYNYWFTPENTTFALHNIANQFLNESKIEAWLSTYKIPENLNSKTIAIVAAGNIPMVAFQDILCVLIAGHKLQIKLAEKDKILLPFILEKWKSFDAELLDKIELVERLHQFDAVIATGSNNAARYFDYYFGKYKNIIRKNRNSIAILDGSESFEELVALGHDVFDYFGLGCRNVSKIFIPRNYDFTLLIHAFKQFNFLENHNAYMNNLDYQRTIYLMNQTNMQDIDFVNIIENTALCSPIACLYYQYYDDISETENFIQTENENIQCVIGKKYLAFGYSQQPSLSDYADNVDTLQFILSL
jgi:hypothetical protein